MHAERGYGRRTRREYSERPYSCICVEAIRSSVDISCATRIVPLRFPNVRVLRRPVIRPDVQLLRLAIVAEGGD